MKILTLHLENFQGIRALTLNFGGRSASIYGANEAGKTTVYNAITWLLFGQASTGAKNFTPKTIGEDGEEHGLNHSVEAIFVCDDSSEVTLRRVYHEVYTKKRGTATETFSGHTTEYYVDGVPVSEKEYNNMLESMCGSMETMRLLTMPDYFPEHVDWQSRRKLLLEVCGDITDDDVIDADPDLHDIRYTLKKPGNTDRLYTVDEYRAIAQRTMADINKQLQSIPARIDEAARAIPTDLDGAPAYADALNKADAIRQDIAMLEAQQRSGNSSARELARKQLLEVTNDLEQARQKHMRAEYEASCEVREQLAVARNRVADMRRNLEHARDALSLLQRKHDSMTARRKELSEKYATVFNQSYAGDESCPYCGQQLPEDRIEAAVAAFNLEKSNKLAEINRQGKECAKELIADIVQQMKQHENQISACETALSEAEAALAAVNSGQRVEPSPFEQTGVYAQLSIRRKDAQQRFDDTLQPDAAQKTNTEQIKELRTKLMSLEHICAQYQLKQAQAQRIEELKKQEKSLAAQYETSERGLSLCELFIRSKVSMLTNRINRYFSSVSFILFQEQINGGLKECCEVAVPAADGSLIPFTFANTAARINAGLEIMSVLSQHFGVSLPVVVDNAESVTTLNGRGIVQLIRLVVSERDLQLRLEVDSDVQRMAG